MFKRAGELAQGLGIHNIDVDGGMMGGVRNPDISDEHRKSFWDLIQVDMFFRLMYNKPPSISGNAWKVNLPWLDPSSQPPPQPDAAMVFLLSSRVTLLLIRFFAMLEECSGDVGQMMRKTEDMCREIKVLYDEWNLVRQLVCWPLRMNWTNDYRPRGQRNQKPTSWRRGWSRK